jgi:WD40 repeat protein
MSDEIGIDIQDDIQRKTQRKPHNGPITKIDVSPNGNYLVTYSQFNRSVACWKVKDKNEGKLEPDGGAIKIGLNTFKGNVEQICVSDDEKLAYIRDKRLSK